MSVEIKVCLYCEKEYEVGGSGRPSRQKSYCSKRCESFHTGATPKELDNETWLRDKYLTENYSFREIGEQLGCSDDIVRKAAHLLKIPIKDATESKKHRPIMKLCAYCSKEFDVGGKGKAGLDRTWCSNSCHMHQQSSRWTGSNAPRPRKYKDTLHNEAWLRTKYLDEKLSTTEIGDQLGCPHETVKWAIRKWNITARSISESKKVLFDKRGRKEIKMKEVVDGYGGKCDCCGESRLAFLSIDHIGGGGAKHRKELGQNHIRKLRELLKAQGWPKDKYRILCMNCNFATRHGKPCPHELERNQLEDYQI
jgi:hypothetical protein